MLDTDLQVIISCHLSADRNYPMKITLRQIINLSDRQEAYYHLVDYYLNANVEEQIDIRKKWNLGTQWVYPNWKRLACCFSETYSPKKRITALLTAVSLKDLKIPDWRDELVGIASIYHSCLLAKVSPEEIFERVASASSPETAKFIRDFCQRSPKEKSLEAFGLQIVMNADGEQEVHFPICVLNKSTIEFLQKNGKIATRTGTFKNFA